MNDLLQTMAVAGGPDGQWASSIDNLDGGDSLASTGSTRRKQRMKELALSVNAIDCEALTLPSSGHGRTKPRLQVKGEWTGLTDTMPTHSKFLYNHMLLF